MDENTQETGKGLTAQDAAAAAEDVRNIIQAATAKDGQPKYKSWLLWVSVVSLAVLCIKIATGQDYTDTASNITTVVFAGLSALGIVNNPNSRGSL